jgi:hypothetical protein
MEESLLNKLKRLKKKIKKKTIQSSESSKHKFVFDSEWKRTKYSESSGECAELKQIYEHDTFENQKDFGKHIFDAFRDRTLLNVWAVAPTQSGKTGSMVATCYEFNRVKDNNISHYMHVAVDNMFVFTGHSSSSWKHQTQSRFPQCMRERIFHRNNLKQFCSLLSGARNVLIIIDEAHIAAKDSQSLYLTYNKTNLFDIRSAYERNIKVIHFTATPSFLEDDLCKLWGPAAKVISMNVPQTYISHEKYLKENRILQCKPLLGNPQNILELLGVIGAEPAYHIIRTPKAAQHLELIKEFKTVFKDKDFVYVSEPSLQSDLNDFISAKPSKHTFIFILDKLRCANTLHLQFVRVLYDRFVNSQKIDTIVQGLSGRATGFHNYSQNIIIFADKEAISKYVFAINHIMNSQYRFNYATMKKYFLK